MPTPARHPTPKERCPLGTQVHLAPTHLTDLSRVSYKLPSEPSLVGLSKPLFGGLWTSSFRVPSVSAPWNVSEWAEVGVSMGLVSGVVGVWLVEPDPLARVLVVDSRADLDAAHEAFGVPLGEWFPFLEGVGFPGGGTFLDWGRVAGSFDAMHLTSVGARGLREMRVGERDMSVWDCESTVWFRPVFESVVRVADVVVPSGAV